jgi:hypothetical protein
MVDIIKAKGFAALDLHKFLVTFVPFNDFNVVLLNVENRCYECNNSIVGLPVSCRVTNAQTNCIIIHSDNLI